MTTSKTEKTLEVVVLDDQDNWLRFFERLNKKNCSKYHFNTFKSYRDALNYLNKKKDGAGVYAVFVDFQLNEDVSGADFIRMAKGAGLNLPYIVCTQYKRSDLIRTDQHIDDLLTQDAASFVRKDDLTFGVNNQNIDEVADQARATHLERSVVLLRQYFHRNSKMIENWRISLASTISKLDSVLVTTSPNVSDSQAPRKYAAKSAARYPIDGLTVTASLIRMELNHIVGSMHIEHIQSLSLAMGKTQPNSYLVEASADDAMETPNYQTIQSVYQALERKARSKRCFELPIDVRRAEISKMAIDCSNATGLDVSIAFGKIVDEFETKGKASQAVELARTAAAIFSQRRDHRREIMFIVVAADMLERSGKADEAEALIDKATRLARSSGDASLQLELMQRQV